MQKRKLEELNVLDDFLFNKLVSHPKIGPEFCKQILSIILGTKIDNIKVVPQKVYYGSDTKQHGIRLDVYVEQERENEVNTIYDIEPDLNDKKSLIVALPERVRFYHAKIDEESLLSGTDYAKLKHVTVIMICDYDPLGRDRMVYTIKRSCIEEPDLPYDDGACSIFLYTKGHRGNPPEDLQKLLHYLEKSEENNADSDVLKNIHKMVQTVKQNREVSIEFMKIYEREQAIRKEGQIEGMEIGRIGIVRKKREKDFSSEEIAELLELDEEYVLKIVALQEEYPEASDIEIAEKILKTEYSNN